MSKSEEDMATKLPVKVRKALLAMEYTERAMSSTGEHEVRVLVSKGLVTERMEFDPDQAWTAHPNEVQRGRHHWLTPLGARVLRVLRAST